MTGDDHNTDALIAALRSPALPAEQVGEAAAVTAMLDALGRAPAPSKLRARRGIAIAAVTVASLGVGGLAAAGPGIFTAAAERARSIMSAEADEQSSDGVVVPGGDDASDTAPDVSAQFPQDQSFAEQAETDVEGAGNDAAPAVSGNAAPLESDTSTEAVECAPGPHGATVSSVAHASIPPEARNRGEGVSEAAQSDCGKGSGQDTGDDDEAGSNGQDPGSGQGNANGPSTNNGQGNINPPGTNNGQGNANGPSTNSGEQGGPPVSTPSGVAPPAGPPASTPSGVVPPAGPPASIPASDTGRGNGQAGADNGQGEANENANAQGGGQGNENNGNGQGNATP